VTKQPITPLASAERRAGIYERDDEVTGLLWYSTHSILDVPPGRQLSTGGKARDRDPRDPRRRRLGASLLKRLDVVVDLRAGEQEPCRGELDLDHSPIGTKTGSAASAASRDRQALAPPFFG